ncbi:3'-N-debenzoyl-2'-deoxytaxol N-benzoyltransferase [Apostasia shenzhenica]|uniref:3'-N-debenzoyl-2'-deoxytaxol N-benzoyltransferase n=1 Tax=Apostasia shenzhenica TaxID=1088818 RepID=A0A2I0B3C5_9ASPA|nr:3'-N-debenzoyl-2'-deoxytaxol N-benzoyltransferase [Apostasia shenzhenica]
MSFTVTKLGQAMVRPAEPTPAGELSLSAIDLLPGLNAKVRTLHVFASGREPAKVIREALSKALVYYYPFAGRLVRFSGDGEVHVACTGGGVWLVEASANCSLRDLNNLEHPLQNVDLLPDPAPEEDPSAMILLMQVTQFDCGGFVVGLENSHCIADGLGTAQFLNAVAEFARGLDSPTLKPAWCPAAIPAPPKRPAVAPAALPPPPRTYHLHRLAIDVSIEDIEAFKAHFFAVTGKTCSAFEALAAAVWQCRTRALVSGGESMKLVFMADARSLVQPALPLGFYANCFFPVSVEAEGSWLARASRVEVVRLIKEAKARLPEEFRRWAAGDGEDPYAPALGYATLFLSEWRRLGFERVDYGWGSPAYVVPLTYTDLIPVCIVGSPPAPAEGIRLSTQCVEEEHLEAFKKHMISAWQAEDLEAASLD